MNIAKHDPAPPRADEAANAEPPPAARTARPPRLPEWKCHRCGARKRLRNAARG